MQSLIHRLSSPHLNISPSHAHAVTGTTLPFINLSLVPLPKQRLQRTHLFRTVRVHFVGVRLCRELLVALGCGLDGLVTGVPVRGADLAVLVGELKGVDEAEGLVDRAADGEVVDCDLADDSGGIDDEEAAEGDAFFFDEDAVVLGELVVLVGEEGDVNLAEATVAAGGVGPGEETWGSSDMLLGMRRGCGRWAGSFGSA